MLRTRSRILGRRFAATTLLVFARSVAVLATALTASAAWADQIDDALALSKKTGRPVLAIAGSDTCAACKALEKSLQSQTSLQPLLAQFVPLRVGFSGTGDYGKWAALYPVEGNSIPKVFVIRADGEKLYGQSGAPTSLGEFLQQQLGASGAILSAAQIDQLSQQVAKAKKLLDEGNVPQAITATMRCMTTKSFAEPAVAASQLFAKIETDGQTAIKQASESLTKSDAPDAQLMAVVTLTETARLYAKLPLVAKAANVALRDVRKEKNNRDVLKQAEAVDAAKDLERKSPGPRAMTKYQQIAKDFPDSPAARFAQERIAVLEKSPGSTSLTSDATGSKTAKAPTGVDEKRAASLLRMAASLADAKPLKAREYAEKAKALAPEGSAAANDAAELLKRLP